MSRVTYDAGTMTITVDGLEDVERALGDLKKKTPAAAKVAINATARQARKLMVAQAKARYAVNAAGRRHLKDLVQRKKATNTSLSAELHIEKMRNDLGYFQHRPTESFKGRDVLRRAPAHVKARVLKSSTMTALTGDGANLSKGFWWSSRAAMWAWFSGASAPAPAIRLQSGGVRGGGTRTGKWKSW
ncbi:MAG: hypothetical protein ACLR4W_14035 [Oscillospiraceae bacterium]